MKKLVIKKQKENNKIGWFILSFLFCLLFFTTKWAFKTYGNINVEEIIFHIKVPLVGIESGLMKSYVLQCILTSLIVSYTIYLIIIIIFTNQIGKMIFLKIKLMDNEFKFKLLPYNNHPKFVLFILLTSLIFELSIDIRKFGFDDFFMNKIQESTLIQENYVDPKTIEYHFPDQKKNLIHIIVESYESSYFDFELGGLKEDNLLNDIMNLVKEGTNFSGTDKYGGAIDTRGTSWTIGSMVAQTAGIPLLLPIDGNSYDKYSSFLPGVYTMGEILESNGYKNYIMLGSDASFAGRDLYFTEHGNYEIFDYKEAKKQNKIPLDYNVWWGFEDSKLYKFAKEKLSSIKNNEEPFNMIILTADTHTLDGYVDVDCDSKYQDNYSNSIVCASKQLYNFVIWLQSQDFYKDTVVVITGDHLTMQPNYVAPYEQRSVFNLILNSDRVTENNNNRLFSVLDMFPTILYSMNIDFNSDKLALGTNLYSNAKTIFEKYTVASTNFEFSKKSVFYNNEFIYKKNK